MPTLDELLKSKTASGKVNSLRSFFSTGGESGADRRKREDEAAQKKAKEDAFKQRVASSNENVARSQQEAQKANSGILMSVNRFFGRGIEAPKKATVNISEDKIRALPPAQKPEEWGKAQFIGGQPDVITGEQAATSGINKPISVGEYSKTSNPVPIKDAVKQVLDKVRYDLVQGKSKEEITKAQNENDKFIAQLTEQFAKGEITEKELKKKLFSSSAPGKKVLAEAQFNTITNVISGGAAGTVRRTGKGAAEEAVTLFRGQPKGAGPHPTGARSFTTDPELARNYAALNQDVTGASEVIKETTAGKRIKEISQGEFLDATENPAIRKQFDGLKFIKEGESTPTYVLFDKVPGQNVDSVKSLISPSERSLNVDRLNLEEQQRAVVKAKTSEEVATLSNKEVTDISSKAGLDTKTYSIDEQRQKIAEQLNVRRAVVSSMEQADALRAAGDTVGAEAALKEVARLGRVSREQGTAIGRELQARKIVANELDSPAQRVFKLLDEAGVNPDVYTKRFATVDFQDAKQVTEAFRDLVKPKYTEWLDLVRYNSMLSSPLTHIINISSNLANSGVITPVTKLIAGTLDFMASPIRKERTMFAGEAGAYLKAYLTNTRNAVTRMSDTFKGKSTFTNLDLKDIPVATKGVKGAVATTLAVPLRILEGMDQFFLALNEAGEKAALQYRRGKGVRVPNLEQQALDKAAYSVFRQDINKGGQGTVLDAIDKLTEGIMNYRNSTNPIVSTVFKFTVPFIKTPMNIFKQGIEYSPLGITTLLKNSNKQEQLAKAIVGSGVWAGAATLLASDRLTWEEPKDPKQRQEFLQAGRQAYSVKIGDTWYSYQKLPPALAFPISMVAALDDAIKDKKLTDSYVDVALNSIARYGSFLADQTYTKSIGDMLASVRGGEEGIQKLISNYPQQLIPYRALSGWIARLADESQRQVDPNQSFIDKQVDYLMLQVPGIREKIPERKDQSGNPIREENNIQNAFSPIKASQSDQKLEEKFQLMEKVRKLNRDKNEERSTFLDSVRPKQAEVKQLMKDGNIEGAKTVLKSMTPEEYEAFKNINAAEKASNSRTFNTLIEAKDKDAMKQFLDMQTESEKQRLIQNFINSKK